MKAVVAFTVILALGATFGTASQAKLAPPEPRQIAAAPDDTDLFSGTAGAMIEASYFRAQQTPFAVGRIFPCRLQVRMFEKTRLAQSCN
jgi:hypothetical protein